MPFPVNAAEVADEEIEKAGVNPGRIMIA